MSVHSNSTSIADDRKAEPLPRRFYTAVDVNDCDALRAHGYPAKHFSQRLGDAASACVVFILLRDTESARAHIGQVAKWLEGGGASEVLEVTLPGFGSKHATMKEWLAAVSKDTLALELDKARRQFRVDSQGQATSAATSASGRTKPATKPRRQQRPQANPLNDEPDTPANDADVVTGDSANQAAPPPPAGDKKPGDEKPGDPYRVTDGRLCQVGWNAKGQPTDHPLCNFKASILEQTVFDDGAEQTRRLRIEGTLENGVVLPEVDVTISEFIRGDWPITHWGCGARVNAGLGVKDHLRAAIQTISEKTTYRTNFGHTGWRKVDGDSVYLHAGGAIGANGPIDTICVELPDALQHYRLPSPPTGTERIAAVQASLGMLRGLAPDNVIISLYATLCRSVLPDATSSAFLVGRTGTGKTELAALIQQHFGPEMNANRLPAHWSGTSNALEAIAFSAKDAILVVDDFNPVGAQTDVARTHKEADRLLRAQGNRSGRQRMRPDGTTRPPKPPRGVILSTGEDVPRGHSLRSRMQITEVGANDVNFKRLGECQHDAAAGIYAQSMAAFIAWLAQHFDKVIGRLKAETLRLRDELAVEDQHKRTPTIVAELIVSFGFFVEFATEVGAITPDQADALRDRCRSALIDSAAQQAQHHADADPCRRYFALLTSAFLSGRAHLLSTAGGRPHDDPDAWGWRETGPKQEWTPMGRSIGWIERDNLYLDPDAAYATANALAVEQGDPMAVTLRTLHKRIAERGLLITTNKERGHLQVRMTFAGSRQNVLHLSVNRLLPDPETVPIGPIGPNVEKPAEIGPNWWADSRNGSDNRPTESAQFSGKNPVNGPIGPIGPIPDTHKTPASDTQSSPAGRKKVRV